MIKPKVKNMAESDFIKEFKNLYHIYAFYVCIFILYTLFLYFFILHETCNISESRIKKDIYTLLNKPLYLLENNKVYTWLKGKVIFNRPLLRDAPSP